WAASLPGSHRSSESRKATNSPHDIPTARLRAVLTPAWACRIYVSFGPNACTTSGVASCEPSSTTISSRCGYVCASTDVIASPTQRARSKVGIITLTRGSSTRDTSITTIANDLAGRPACKGAVFDYQHAIHSHVRHASGIAARRLALTATLA